MCFTAGASFASSAVLATAGTATLREVHSKRELLLAIFPVVFSVHQLIEGVLWLTIGRGQLQPLVHGLAVGYVVVAYGFWPTVSSAALYLIEPDAKHKKPLLWLLVLGACASLYLLYFISRGHVQASIVHHSIYYDSEIPHPDALTALYATATLLPFFFSSYPPLRAIGVVNLALCGVAFVVYHVTFHSVWCFFAAAFSINIYVFLRWSHRRPLQQGGNGDGTRR